MPINHMYDSSLISLSSSASSAAATTAAPTASVNRIPSGAGQVTKYNKIASSVASTATAKSQAIGGLPLHHKLI
ncbi:hypothetical protein HDU86_000443 [Geranomyces michiganensis]|nr:hypothetical protein HDU86_000443 [Geranomyces michiganensis]